MTSEDIKHQLNNNILKTHLHTQQHKQFQILPNVDWLVLHHFYDILIFDSCNDMAILKCLIFKS